MTLHTSPSHTMNINTLPVECLRESPFNYRKTFTPAAMAELAESIKAIGIQQPLKARPIPDTGTHDQHRYELVFGHRRLRAAIQAGLEYVPVMIEEMSDEDVRITQLSENLQREDVNPIEEAEALRELNMAHRVSVEQLVADTGKSKSHIYATMRLVRLADDVKAAVMDGTIGREIAVLIATLPTALHAQALKLVTQKEGDTTVALSYRTAKRLLSTNLTISLEKARFDIEAHDLVERGACTTCPHRAGNDPALAAELDADVCTDTGCFNKKAAAHLALLATAHKAAGGEVLEGEEALAALPYPGADWYYDHKSTGTVVGKADGKDLTIGDVLQQLRDEGKPTPVVRLLIDTRDNSTHELVRKEDLQPIIDHVRSAAEDGSVEPTGLAALTFKPEPTRQQATERTFASERHKLAFNHFMDIREACMKACLAAPRTGAEVHLMLQMQLEATSTSEATELFEHFGWREQINALPEDERPNEYQVSDWVAKHCVPNMTLDDCSAALVWLALANAPIGFTSDEDFPERVLALAAMYDIDVEAVASAAAAERQAAGDQAQAEDDLGEADED